MCVSFSKNLLSSAGQLRPHCHSPPFFAEAKTGNWQRFLLLFTFNRFHCLNGIHNLFTPGNLCQAFFAEIFQKFLRSKEESCGEDHVSYHPQNHADKGRAFLKNCDQAMQRPCDTLRDDLHKSWQNDDGT